MRRLARQRLALSAGVAILLTAATPAYVAGAGAAPIDPADGQSTDGRSTADDAPRLIRVVDPGQDGVSRLQEAGFDLAERRVGDDFFVVGDSETTSRLRGLGYTARAGEIIAPPRGSAGVDRSSSFAAAYPTFYGGYHTTKAHEQHLVDVSTAKPELAKLVDIGDSWLKEQGQGGHDIWAICLTKIGDGDCALDPAAPKPRLLVTSSIHPRELATAEISWEMIDHLAEGYGQSAPVTELLDSTEVWVVPIINPDGHDVVEGGGDDPILQRKNLNANSGGCTGTGIGTDLNRNFPFQWGGEGASAEECAETHRGAEAGSEPETQALVDLSRQLFADRKDGNAPAPDGTTGAIMTYHSFAGLILYPWGYTNADTPNNAGLRALAEGMAAFNGYDVGQPGEVLYNASGVTDDSYYGDLGVPTFTTELLGSGECDGFFAAYSCVASKFWPEEREALMWLGSKVKAPYQVRPGS